MLKTLYKGVTSALSPFLKYCYLKRSPHWRQEDPLRLAERWGETTHPKAEGDLVWFHAASVGEVVSLIPILKKFHHEFREMRVLVTTGTVTSAKVIAPHLPSSYIHQYIPLDVPQWVEHFLEHWNPKVAIFVEAELWPNLLFSCKERHIPVLLLNAHLSDKSYQRWRKVPTFVKQVLECVDEVMAQSSVISERLKMLGAKKVSIAGNLKFAVDPLAYNEDALQKLMKEVAGRPLWVAASTHPGEEEQIALAHQKIKEKIKDVLTILVPRHPHRGQEISTLLNKHGLTVAQRTKSGPIEEKTDIYLADTIGELGLFYKLSEISFVGGSLVPIGGHNPIEPAKLGCALIWGPHTLNQREICSILNPAALSIKNTSELAETVIDLLQNPKYRQAHIDKAQEILKSQSNVLEDIFTLLRPFCT